jgi:enediyne biosynthesis protein E4
MTLVKQLVAGTSYLSTPEKLLHFGLGTTENPVSMEITWPSGRTQSLTNISTNQRLEIVESERTDR